MFAESSSGLGPRDARLGEFSTNPTLRVRALGVLDGPFDGRQPRLATLDPDLCLRLHAKRGIVEGSDPKLDVVLVEAEQP
jgi:hypothetical protein